MKRLGWAALGCILVAGSAYGDAETDALRAQIKMLEARLDALEKERAAQPAAPAKLEERVNILERKEEVATEEAKTAAAKTPTVEYGNRGLLVTSPDKQFQLRMRGYIQADNRTFFDNSNAANFDQFLIRSARPIIEAKMYDNLSGRIMLDFGNGQSRLLDAFADYKVSDALAIQFGKFKVPLGIERWQSEQEILFVERGMSTNLVPFRDIGVQLHGELIPQTLEYQLAFTNGSVDFDDVNGDPDDAKEITARLFATPFRNADSVMLQGISLGVAGSYGHREGSVSNVDLTTGYRTPGQARFFTYRNDGTLAGTTYAYGADWRINPQAMFYSGPFSLIGEYVRESQEVRRNTSLATLSNDAWTAITTYVLTGEDASFDGVRPRENFDPVHGGWGAFELVGRYGYLHVDNAAFPIFANPATSARNALEWTGGLTWYWNPSLKFNVDYSNTRFDGGATTGDRETENTLLSRAQLRF